MRAPPILKISAVAVDAAPDKTFYYAPDKLRHYFLLQTSPIRGRCEHGLS